MMLTSDFQLDVYRAMCAAAWIMFFLIMKNIVLVILLAIQRRKYAIYKIPEDADTFGTTQPSEYNDDYGLAGRIQKALANDVEYVPYFLVLLVIMFCRVDLVSQDNHHYLARVMGYGLLFTIGRYLHTISYLMRNTYGRILGFLITIIILIALLIDHLYYITKALHDFSPKP